MKDVAEDAHVSVPLVSQILNGRDCRVTEEKRQEVIQAARRLGYHVPVKSATGQSARSKILGLIIPNLERDFFVSLVTQISEATRNAGYELCTFISGDDSVTERKHIDYCRSKQFAGLFVNPSDPRSNGEYYDWLTTLDLPVVFVDRSLFKAEIKCVSSDNFAAAYHMTEKLIEAGHEKIVFVLQGEVQFTSVLIERFDGYCEAMRAHNLTPAKETIYCALDVSEQPIIDFDNYSAAVLCTSTKIVQILSAMKQRRNSVNRLSIATFDPIRFSVSNSNESHVFEAMTSDIVIALQDTKKMANAAVGLMLKSIDGDRAAERVMISCAFEQY